MCVECGTPLSVSTLPWPSRSGRSSATRSPRARTRRRSRRRSCGSTATRCSPTRRRRLQARCGSSPIAARAARGGRDRVRPAALAGQRAGARDAAPAPAQPRGCAPPGGGSAAVNNGVDTTVIAAFAVGFVSFISPCVLPLVPGYLSAVSGVSLAEIRAGERRPWRILLPAIVFCLCFTVVFVALGMTATGLGSTLQDSRGTLDKIAGLVIVALGVFFLLTPFVPKLNQEWRPDALITRAGSGGPLVAGRGVRGRLDALRRPHARLDPHRGLHPGHRGPGRGPAGLLLRRAARAVPAHRARVRPRPRGVPLAARPYLSSPRSAASC